MALSQCADDVLLSIASHIHHDPQPASYDIDFEARRRKFQPLVLVCRRLHAVYTPLLYRTLSLKHERNTWPAAHKPAWLQQSPERRVMDALCRTLQQVPALCLCTYFLEVRWDGHDDTAEDHESVKTYIGVFPRLRGLHVSAPQQPHLDSREWTPNPLCRATLLEALTELRTTQPVAARMLPKIFFLPNLHTLEATVLDAREISSWSVPPGAQPRRSGIVHLFLTAGLTSRQLLQLLSWPAALRTFVYHHKSCPGSYALVPTVNAFKTALQPFRRTLVALKVAILDSYVNGVNTVDEDLQFDHEESRCPYLDMSSFYSLKDLQLPSHFLVGYPRNDYMRDNIPDLLPSSLRSFEINFGPDDLFLSRDWHQHVWGFPLQHRPFNGVGKNRWLYALSQYSLKGGPFSHLQNIVVSDTGRTEAWGQAAGLRRTFAGIDVHIHVALASPPMYLQEDGEEYQNREDWSDYWENGAPIFGQELTEHSSSPRGTEIEWLEQEYVEEMLLMDEWEGFDAMMAGERERLSESWVKGQWPDYEDSREERDEMFR